MLLDSNIVVYSINDSSPKNRKAQNFIQKFKDKLFIAHQNVFESLRILTHKKFPNPMNSTDAIYSINKIAKAIKIIKPNFDSFYLALELIKKYQLKSDQVFDAYLVGTAISNNIQTIATDNDKDFKKIAEINTYNPFSNSN
ncbi:hypothetical protein A2774_01125 [Candidatus Roizmanbacteria bacterium RIFCSPHIGHO2_01_FULL_39_12c]|uniref:PIN domain-containing protein n=1 Tax=Candidatus Roizmanbacteria bacterium RIFCSPHIGHO2_01_FULL_39_12c TaxID=1802031 RepID=A0A1F7G824_9BACT|nr:MAG: hypothetical protein A2774_01125 [Candidatus Roizmanbacteria bacterium RIFCSPHIGHO2_01_FULL_39_12c]OGK46432.1 MAG: hypothetical protein A2963_01535 [Candidatus Roizmanbacteria bacterium RIFCSPLOWO2_01_FULL_40_13]